MSHHSDLIDTTEMYLRTVYELEEEGVVALRARIAERLGQSGPTVSQTVARMERDGLLHVADFTVPLAGGGFGYTAFVIDAYAGLIPGWRDGYGVGYRTDGTDHPEDQARADRILDAAIRSLTAPTVRTN